MNLCSTGIVLVSRFVMDTSQNRRYEETGYFLRRIRSKQQDPVLECPKTNSSKKSSARSVIRFTKMFGVWHGYGLKYLASERDLH